jgi:peptidyl-prolyl cis-trans isomerase D
MHRFCSGFPGDQAMLNVLRENFKHTPYLKVVLVAVGLGLVAYLGNYFFGTGNVVAGNWSARVNGVEITFQDFRQRAGEVDARYRQLLGDAYDQFRQPQRIAQEAIELLISEQLILQDAEQMGLRASRQQIADLLLTNPQFQDPTTGQFIGTERYLELVGGESAAAAYETRLANELLKQRWAGLVGQAVTIDDEELRDIFRKRTEKTAISYVILDHADQEVEAPEDDGVLRQWYDERQDEYVRDESRRIRYVVVERDMLKDRVEVTDEEIAAFYQSNQSKYEHPEQRRARHILFRIDPNASDEDKATKRKLADETLEQLKTGADFAVLARATSEDTFSAEKGGDLGFFSRTDMVEAFSDAAFTTGVGEFAPLTESPFGLHVIQVTDTRPQGVTPLGDVEDDIRRDLEIQASQQLVEAEASRIRGEIGDTAEKLAEVAANEGLQVQSRLVVGRDPLRDIGASPEFAANVSQLELGVTSNPLRMASGMALVTVDETLPEAIAPFEEVRDRVAEDEKQARAKAAAQAAAFKAMEELAEIEAVAKALGKEVRTSGDLAPGQGIPGAGGPSPEIEEVLFGPDVYTGDAGVLEVPTGALAYQVTGRVPFDDTRFENERTDLRAELLLQQRARYGQSVLSQLRQTQDIEINPSVLNFN